jgi:eukaryotic-like serine/threonine-protein kinase
MTLVGRVFSGRYEIQREVAQGGMAEVYLAHDQLLNRPVALKALFPEYAREPSFVERFRREAQAAANLNHPNIVAIHDWGQEEGTYFIVMEYVEGRSLRDLIRSEAPLDPSQASEITAETASALAFAHRSGVVHRDVKPGNVLLTRTGTVKVTDFGIARAGASDGLTQTGSVMGTATYFSPEQAQGLPVDGRSDVYALGVVLYEMVTGVAPFTGDSPVSVAYKHVREDVVPPSQRNPEIPPDLEQVIMTALAKNADERYQTADDLRADLLRFRRGRPLAPVTAMVAQVPTGATPAQAAATMATPVVDDRGRQVDAPTYARKKRNPALITVLVLLGLVAVILLILWAASTLGDSEDTVTVPDVVGKTVTEAQKTLTDAHLGFEIERQVNAAVEVDHVISQDPGPGDARRNTTVKLIVSDGAEQVDIPADIIGKPEAEATAQLQALGFQVKPEQKVSEQVDAGLVIDSDPAAGTSAGKGAAITLFISSGKAPTEIPNVAGLSLDQAGQLLAQRGFLNVQPKSESSTTVSRNDAIRTEPAAGQKVPLDTPITIIYSSGPPTVAVPPVVGDAVADARAELEAAGFTVSTLNVTDAENVNKVVSQDPGAGTQAAKGSNVVLRVGVAPAGGNTTTTTEP